MRFHAGRAPSREELASVAERVEKQMTRWLQRKGLLDRRPPERVARSRELRGGSHRNDGATPGGTRCEDAGEALKRVARWWN